MADNEKPRKDEGETPKDPAAPAKKGKKKLILIAVIAVVVLAVGGGAAFFFLKSPKSTDAGAQEGTHAEEAAAPAESGGHGGGHGDAKAKGPGAILALEPFIVNLQDNSGTRYLKVTINLDLSGASEEVTAQMAKIRDSVLILLSSKSYSDIGTVEGKYQLRDEIVARVNQHLAKTKVKTVYFTDFVIQ